LPFNKKQQKILLAGVFPVLSVCSEQNHLCRAKVGTQRTATEIKEKLFQFLQHLQQES
jgi:hypothetical protein